MTVPIAYTFSIATILDELTTPPIAFENGRYVEKAMLSDPEPGKFPRPIGNIVLRHSIHSELGTLAESFRKKGVREVFFKINYEPQLVNLVQNLAHTGFTSREPIAVNGTRVAPRAVLLALLQKHATTKTPKDVEALQGGCNRAAREAANRGSDGNVGRAFGATAAFRRRARHRLSGCDCGRHAWPR